MSYHNVQCALKHIDSKLNLEQNKQFDANEKSHFISNYIMERFDSCIESLIQDRDTLYEKELNTMMTIIKNIINTPEFDIVFRKYTRYQLFILSNIFDDPSIDELDTMINMRKLVIQFLSDKLKEELEYFNIITTR